MELNQTIALALPRPAHAETGAFEPQLPQIAAPGADIDVDSPDEPAVVDSDDEAIAKSQPDASAAIDAAIDQTTASIESPVAGSATATDTTGAQLQLASLGAAPAVFDTGAGTETGQEQAQNPDDGEQAADAPAASVISDTANAEDARYTIQVGVFADQDNALRRLSELEALQLSAYVNEHTNKREEIRYTVRFGYFKNKSSALAALDVFEHNLSGSGYVARIRRPVIQ